MTKNLSLVTLFTLLALTLSAGLGCSSAQPEFDKGRAFDFLKQQVAFGPRYAGVTGHDKCANFIASQLKPYADDVRTQDFRETIGGKELQFRNVIARFNRDAKETVLLAAHWDTRPVADMEVDLARRSKPIPGANDGASGVAVLLELARMFAKQKPEIGVTMVFFDGEDYTTNPPSTKDMFLGSKYFAYDWQKNRQPRHPEPDSGSTFTAGHGTEHPELVEGSRSAVKNAVIRYGILLDMIGDRDLRIYKEVRSVSAAPDVVNQVWDAARALGYDKTFIPAKKHEIQDDHIPLIKVGIKCIDVIDFDYGPWHTLDDTVDKCSADSLKIVGDVIARVVYEEKGS